MTDVPAKRHRVQATVYKWRNESDAWPWGFAQIESGEPTKQAYIATKTLGIKPPLGQAFTCELDCSEKGWRVAFIVDEEGHIPEVLESVQVTIESLSRKGKDSFYTLAPCTSGNWTNRRLILEQRFLDEAGIALIRPEVAITVDLNRDGIGYKVAKLHAPLAAHALRSGTAEDPASPRRAVAFPLSDWDALGAKKGVFLATHDQGADISAKVWIWSDALKALGISSLKRASLPETDSLEHSLALIDAWADILANGNEEDIESLEIDRLLIEVVTAKNGAAWALHRLIAPGEVRVGAEGEIVDWVNATVTKVEDHRKKLKAVDSALSSDDADDTFKKKISFSFQDERVGRGASTGFVDERTVEGAGLAPGVPAIIRLKSKQHRWYASHVHRCIPSDTKAIDD